MLAEDDQGPGEVDPAELAPLCDEAEFAELVDELVAEDAPRLFAVLQEYGERADGRIAAWGMAFPDYADVVGVDHGFHLRMRSPERAAHAFHHRPHITTRVIWLNSDAAGAGGN